MFPGLPYFPGRLGLAAGPDLVLFGPVFRVSPGLGLRMVWTQVHLVLGSVGLRGPLSSGPGSGWFWCWSRSGLSVEKKAINWLVSGSLSVVLF